MCFFALVEEGRHQLGLWALLYQSKPVHVFLEATTEHPRLLLTCLLQGDLKQPSRSSGIALTSPGTFLCLRKTDLSS